MIEKAVQNYQKIATSAAQNDAVLVAVSKRQPDDLVQAVYDAGCRIFGENDLGGLLGRRQQMPDAQLHFIGRIQSRKLPEIIRNADVIQSICRSKELKIAHTVEQESGLKRKYLLQVNLGQEEQKNGIYPGAFMPFLANAKKDFPDLDITGIMGLGPVRDTKEEVRSDFRLCVSLRSSAQEAGFDLPELSLGMSDNWRQALAEGATMIRVGSALFGERAY